MKAHHPFACAALAALGAVWALSAAAQDTATSGSGPPTSTSLEVASNAGLFAQPVDADTLSSFRGGAQAARNDMELTGTTSDNSARNVATGTNSIGTGAFSNMSGLPIVIQNSGANVLIQNAVILNLQMN